MTFEIVENWVSSFSVFWYSIVPSARWTMVVAIFVAGFVLAVRSSLPAVWSFVFDFFRSLFLFIREFLLNLFIRPTMVLVLVLSAIVLSYAARFLNVFGILEFVVLVIVFAVATINFDLILDELIAIYGVDEGRTLWKDSSVLVHYYVCAGIFFFALLSLIADNAFAYIFLLSSLYMLYCYSNGVTMRLTLANRAESGGEKSKHYYSFLASTLAVAREENWPALLGYIILFLAMAVVYSLHQFGAIEVDVQKEMKAYIAGAATVHLGISSIKFYRSIRYRAGRRVDDHDTIDLIILGHEVSAHSMQMVVQVADNYVVAIPRRLRITGAISLICLGTTFALSLG